MSGHEASVGVAVLLLGIGWCGEPATSPKPAPSPPLAAAPEMPDREESFDASGSVAWSSLVRDEDWDGAHRILEGLPEDEKESPPLRYVRARVALARGDDSAALALLFGLESSLPLLAGDIERWRAEARLAVGPYVDAGEWFAARAGASAQLDAARAFEKAGDTRRARGAADRVITAEKKTRAEEGEARAIRLRLSGRPSEAGDAGDTEWADARWLAIQGADLASASDALAALSRQSSRHALRGADWLARAEVLSESGHTEEALRSIESASTVPFGDRPTYGEHLHARGMALYKGRGRYGEAAKVLAESAAHGGDSAAEDAFHAARALSRADRDEEAIQSYEDVERRFPQSTWADQAAFFVPYLRMLHGDWRQCVRDFGSYMHRRRSGEPSRDARSDAALCALLDGDAKSARVAFEHLVEDEADSVGSARLANLAALAAFRDGDRAHAVMRWTDVAKTRPLTWPALVARARLAEIGAPVPAPIDARPPPPFPDPAPLAVAIPPPAELLVQLGLEKDAETAIRERESVVTSGAGARAPEALCAAYGQLGRARRRYQIAQSLPSSLFAVAPGPGTRWAWDCAFPAPYAHAVHDAEAKERLPPGLLWAVMRQESAFDPDAISSARAVGLMQLMPETAHPLADELSLPRDDARLTSPSYAIRVGARALRKLLDSFHGSVPLAVAAYNGGADAVMRWASRAPDMQIDTFVERIPFKETRDYVIRVMGNLARYEYLSGADAGIIHVTLAL